MKRTNFTLLGAFVGFAALLCGVYPALAQSDPTVGLTKLPQFGVLSGAAVTGSTGAGTLVNGDVGSGNSSITNFIGSTIPGPSRTVPPFLVHYATDAAVAQALLDARAAWNNMGAQGLLPIAQALGPQLSGQVLNAGIYNFAAAADLASPGGVVTGTLTLNGPGFFIFNVGSSLTANVGSSVVGTADPCKVFWRMGINGSATLNGVNFFGTVIADQAVTVASSNNLTGKAVGIVAAVTMPGAGGNTIGGCSAAAACPVITVNPATLPTGNVGTAYNQTVSGSGGTAPYTFAVTSGALPTGLVLNGATGAITGTPTTLGTSNFTITAADANGCPGSRAYAMGIAAAGCPFITLSPATLPAGVAGAAYNQTVSASGGTAPYTFVVSSGALPNGLVLNGATGAITGTPTGLGNFNFTIQATDANGCPGLLAAAIAIASAASGSTLNFVGVTILMILLAGAGLFVMNRFSL